MITYQQALTADQFHHVRLRNADGTPLRARRNGRTQTWKTRPGKFRVPCKIEFYDCHDITHEAVADWEVAP